jgi:tetratricopeptide (TPR) repeat protein
MPTAPEVTPATILVGRAMLGSALAEPQRDAMRKTAERCQEELRARAIRLLDSVELLDVWLLAAQTQFLLELPERVNETVLTLRESPYFADMRAEQFLDYHFLLGYGALGTGKHELAMRALEWFLLHAEGDPRRGLAMVLLAESYMAQKRFVQARAASIEARTRFLATMTSEWRERTLRVWARSALALGEKESAFLELEQMVMRGEEPELALFLVDEMLADRQWQRAIAIASPMIGREDAVGDRARFKTVVALYQQAAAGSHFDDFPGQAILLVPRIQNADLRSKTAEMIGDAYTRLGKLEHAADAYRGILR